MNMNGIKNAITSRAGRQILIAQKHSPHILFAIGVVGVVGTAVLAAKATLNLSDILEEHEKVKNDIDNAVGAEMTDGSNYGDEHHRKDTFLLTAKTSLQITKLYAPAIAVGAISVAALTGSHFILNSRNVALTAAYAAVEKGYRQYRDRVVAEYGLEVDQKLRQDMEMTEVSELKADGKTKKTKVATGVKGLSEYSVIFDEGNKNWQRPDHYNSMFLRSQQNWANDMLNSRGHVFLNEVYDMLGFPRTTAGALVGWVKSKKDEAPNGDGYIDFGVFRGDSFMGKTFVNGDERSIILDFNVDGPIYAHI